MYISIKEALKHAGRALSTEVKIAWLDAERYERCQLKDYDGILIPGGFGKRGIEGKIEAIRFARENNVPFLGLCLGFQLATIEYARNKAGIADATSEEFGDGSHVIALLPEQEGLHELGGTMRLGNYTADMREKTLALKLYNERQITERHRHRYEVNPEYIARLEKAGLVFSATNRNRMECMELPGHPFYFATQFHPEFKSRPTQPSPRTSVSWKRAGRTRGRNREGSMVNTEKFIRESIDEIMAAAGDDRVVMALSGGVDSSVCAALAARAIGDRLIPIYIDTGLMRKGETERIRTIFDAIHLQVVDAGDEFLEALRGITDPEAKRKAIGERFIRVFEREARKQGATCLLQGTIYPDRIESEGGIKSHHNVGGMPLHMEFTKVIEPIRDLYKDEVREVAGALGLPKEIQHRMPFPGPGLAVRVLGEVTEENVAVIREANWIVEDELVEKYRPWQCFAALLGLGTGVKGDNRIHGWIIAIRAVNSRDGMTADPLEIPFDQLVRIGSRITSDIPSVARVVYDITAKPPATIEYE